MKKKIIALSFVLGATISVLSFYFQYTTYKNPPTLYLPISGLTIQNTLGYEYMFSSSTGNERLHRNLGGFNDFTIDIYLETPSAESLLKNPLLPYTDAHNFRHAISDYTFYSSTTYLGTTYYFITAKDHITGVKTDTFVDVLFFAPQNNEIMMPVYIASGAISNMQDMAQQILTELQRYNFAHENSLSLYNRCLAEAREKNISLRDIPSATCSALNDYYLEKQQQENPYKGGDTWSSISS